MGGAFARCGRRSRCVAAPLAEEPTELDRAACWGWEPYPEAAVSESDISAEEQFLRDAEVLAEVEAEDDERARIESWWADGGFEEVHVPGLCSCPLCDS